MRFLCLFLMCLPLAIDHSYAQAWFTRDVCDLSAPTVHPGIVDDARMRRLDAEAAGIANSTGRLWRITSPEGAVSHLWGTLHSTQRDVLDLPTELRSAIDKARVIAGEADHTGYSRGDLMDYAKGDRFYRMLPTDPILYIDPKVQGAIEARLSALGYQQVVTAEMMPAAIFGLIISDPCDDFYIGTYPIQDNRILMLGREAGAAVAGLEMWDDVERTLNDPDNVEMVKGLIDGYGFLLTKSDRFLEYRSTFFSFYLQGRIGHMMAMDREENALFFGEQRGAEVWGHLQGYLVDQRNLGFVENAIPMLEEGAAVLAVGAYHLPGRNGMVSLFRQRGFTVERVRTEGEVP